MYATECVVFQRAKAEEIAIPAVSFYILDQGEACVNGNIILWWAAYMCPQIANTDPYNGLDDIELGAPHS